MSRSMKQLLSVVSCRMMPQRYKGVPTHLRENVVSSPALDQLDQVCERIRPIPPPPVAKVAVLGAATDVGLITCLFLKQYSTIKKLAMYEDFPSKCRNVIGHANDIAHIDTSPAVEAYQGKTTLPMALRDAQVVLICAGWYACVPCKSDHELFQSNASLIRWYACAIAEFAPNAIVCIQTPPVDANFNLVRQTLKQYRVYDKRKLLGVNAITTMRANQLYCALADLDPMKSYCPCICGTGRCSRVPVFSSMNKYESVHKGQIDMIARLVREADDLICKVKCSTERAHLSIGFSTARMIVNVFRGVCGGKGFIDSALVEQDEPSACYGLEICASPVNISETGISSYCIPKLSEKEVEMLATSREYLEDMLYLGGCFAMGEDYYVCPMCQYCPCINCPEAKQAPPKLAKKC